MAIQMRRGNYSDLDASKLVAGEIVVATDTGYVGVTLAPSNVVELAKKSDVEEVTPTVTNGALIFGASS